MSKKLHIMTSEEYDKLKKERAKQEKQEFKKRFSFIERCYLKTSALVFIFGLMCFLYKWSVSKIFSLMWFLYGFLSILFFLCAGGAFEIFEKLYNMKD